METETITMKKCLIMFMLLLFTIFVSRLSETVEDIRPNAALLANDNTSKSYALATEIGQ